MKYIHFYLSQSAILLLPWDTIKKEQRTWRKSLLIYEFLFFLYLKVVY